MDLLRTTINSLRAHKLRFVVTSLGITWGALMLTLLSSNMAGVREHFRVQLEKVGPKVVLMWPGYVMKKRVGERGARSIKIVGEDMDRVDNLESVERVAPDMLLWSQIVRAGSRTKLLPVNGGTEQTRHIRSFEVDRGRFLSPTDVRDHAKVAFLGSKAASRLFGRANPVGETIQIESVSFRVIGVSVGKGDQLVGINGNDDSVVLIPYTTLQRHFARDDRIGQFIFSPTRRQDGLLAARHIRQVLGLHHDFDPDVATAFETMSIYETLKGIYAMFDALQFFQVAAGVITLFVGAVGVMNIMLVVVGERTHEIGLRKAVGATTRAIFWQFLAEAVAVAVVSGVVGAALGIALSQLLATYQPPGTPASSPPVFDPMTIGAVIVSLVVVAIVAGVAPALRAARVPPAEALRAT